MNFRLYILFQIDILINDYFYMVGMFRNLKEATVPQEIHPRNKRRFLIVQDLYSEMIDYIFIFKKTN